MAWTVYGTVYESASDLTDTTLSQPVKPKTNLLLRGVRTWIIFVDDPVITSFNMKIYSSDNNTPKKLLYTSTDSRTKAELLSDNSGVKETYFTFNDVPLNGETTYHFVLNGVGYTPTSSSYVAWRRGWPDPVYQAGFTPNKFNLGGSPFELYLIGGEF